MLETKILWNPTNVSDAFLPFSGCLEAKSRKYFKSISGFKPVKQPQHIVPLDSPLSFCAGFQGVQGMASGMLCQCPLQPKHHSLFIPFICLLAARSSSRQLGKVWLHKAFKEGVFLIVDFCMGVLVVGCNDIFHYLIRGMMSILLQQTRCLLSMKPAWGVMLPVPVSC